MSFNNFELKIEILIYSGGKVEYYTAHLMSLGDKNMVMETWHNLVMLSRSGPEWMTDTDKGVSSLRVWDWSLGFHRCCPMTYRMLGGIFFFAMVI